MFKTIATMIFSTEYSARNESNVVNEAGPATNGNAKGIIEAPPSGPLFL